MKSIKSVEGVLDGSIDIEFGGKIYTVVLEGNLVLPELSVVELKNKLNELPGRLAFWKNIQAQIERTLSDYRDEMDLWYQEKYMQIDQDSEKKTETWKKAKTILDNSAEYLSRKKRIKDLEETAAKVGALVSAYTNMVWTLRELSRLTLAELGSLSNQEPIDTI